MENVVSTSQKKLLSRGERVVKDKSTYEVIQYFGS